LSEEAVHGHGNTVVSPAGGVDAAEDDDLIAGGEFDVARRSLPRVDREPARPCGSNPARSKKPGALVKAEIVLS